MLFLEETTHLRTQTHRSRPSERVLYNGTYLPLKIISLVQVKRTLFGQAVYLTRLLYMVNPRESTTYVTIPEVRDYCLGLAAELTLLNL